MILVGGAIIGFAYLSKNFEGILEACQSINGMVGGPTIGFYTIGIFLPFISELPAMMGLVCGLSVSIWVFFGSNKFPAGPEERFQLKSDTIDVGDEKASLRFLSTTLFWSLKTGKSGHDHNSW